MEEYKFSDKKNENEKNNLIRCFNEILRFTTFCLIYFSRQVQFHIYHIQIKILMVVQSV